MGSPFKVLSPGLSEKCITKTLSHMNEQLINTLLGSFEGVRNKDVKQVQTMDMDVVVYKLLVALEDGFGKKLPEQNRKRHRYWYSVKPMTNMACDIGRLVSNTRDLETEEKRNTRFFKVGFHLLQAIATTEGWLEIKRGDNKRDKYKVRVQKGKEEEFLKFLEVVDTGEIDIPIYSRPQFERPFPFTRFYHEEAGALVRNINPEARRSFTMEECPKVFEVINKHMNIAYKINLDILDVYKQCQDDDIFTFANKDLDEEQLQGLERERDKVLELATMVGDRKFWEYMFYDNRGRLYSSSVYLSHAGCKLSKSLYLYEEGKPIGKDGWFWMLVHASNCYGYDKDSIDGRFDFAAGQLDQWVEIGKDPVKNKLWQQADSPFEFLAAAMEIYKAVASGDRYNFVSALPVAWDASCSGLQVLSALARDEESGALCNLTETEERGDYYLMIADHVWKECTYDLQSEKMFKKISKDLDRLEKEFYRAIKSGNKERIKAAKEATKEYHSTHKANIFEASKVFWGRPEMVKMRRKICKRPCMTYFYSCGAKTMSKAMYSDHAAEPEFKGLNSYFCFWLAKRIFEACEQLMPTPTSLMRLFIELGLNDYKEGKDFDIYAPYTNFHMIQYYRQDKTKQVDVMYRGKRIQPIVTIGKKATIDRSKVISATSPNVVHMLDSQIVAAMIMEADYTMSTIHDSFSSLAADAGKLYEDTRNVFVDLFDCEVLLALLEQKDAGQYMDDVKFGKLDLTEVYTNEHCFS